jgi:16S rRNA (guanine527-N7)-methyltransferase
VQPEHIAALLAPFLPQALAPAQLAQLSAYLELLLRWNARINLTTVRDPEHIVQRHFGESLFAAAHLYPRATDPEPAGGNLVDLGSGAGFPGLPIKIWAPTLRLTLIESQNRKATFLREVARTLQLSGLHVFSERAQRFPPPPPPLTITLRAVERFHQVLPVAARLLAFSPAAASDSPPPSGSLPPAASRRLALLIGASQVASAHQLLPRFSWHHPAAIPQSDARVLLVGFPAD